jgi:hypothetical protein
LFLTFSPIFLGTFSTLEPLYLGLDDLAHVSIMALIWAMHLAKEGSLGFLLQGLLGFCWNFAIFSIMFWLFCRRQFGYGDFSLFQGFGFG